MVSPVVVNTAYNQHSYYTSFTSDRVFYTPFCLHIELSSLPWISVKINLLFSCYMSSWLTARQTKSIRISAHSFASSESVLGVRGFLSLIGVHQPPSPSQASYQPGYPPIRKQRRAPGLRKRAQRHLCRHQCASARTTPPRCSNRVTQRRNS